MPDTISVIDRGVATLCASLAGELLWGRNTCHVDGGKKPRRPAYLPQAYISVNHGGEVMSALLWMGIAATWLQALLGTFDSSCRRAGLRTGWRVSSAVAWSASRRLLQYVRHEYRTRTGNVRR